MRRAGNSEAQNKRRSQNGEIAVLNKAPVAWASKVSSVGFAHPDIGEAHADRSSGAAEVYGAGEASRNLLALSYIAKELDIPYPKPMLLEMDASTAVAFVNGTARRSKLSHIDAGQEWVITLRNKELFVSKHVEGKLNLADIGTKLQGQAKMAPLMAPVLRHVPKV